MANLLYCPGSVERATQEITDNLDARQTIYLESTWNHRFIFIQFMKNRDFDSCIQVTLYENMAVFLKLNYLKLLFQEKCSIL